MSDQQSGWLTHTLQEKKIMKRIRLFGLIALGALILAACAPAATTAPTQASVATEAPTQVVMPTATTAPTEAPTAVPATPTTAAPTPVATIPAENLVQKGKLLICTDFPYPPQEMYDENGNPVGTDIDIGNEIAKRLGLQPVYVNSVFDTIIAAVTGGKCDIIISAMNITAERNKQVSMIPYFKAGQGIVVAKGNPDNINGAMDLCGQNVAAESGTTEADYLQGTGDYKGAGLPAECTKAGKAKPKVIVTQKDSDALQQLLANKVVAYMADSPVAAYYTVQHPDQFQVVGEVIEPILEGINMPCGEADCTKAPLSPVGKAVLAALTSMIQDGTYTQILSKWNLTSGAITLDDLKNLQ
jgi:polar amino acid transport system substrate-binding protein